MPSTQANAMNRDGTGLRRITKQNYYSTSSPRFLRDGKSVIYSAFVQRAGRGTISTAFLVNTNGAQAPEPLAKNALAETKFFAWASRPYTLVNSRKPKKNQAPARGQLSTLLKFSVLFGEVVFLQRNLSKWLSRAKARLVTDPKSGYPKR